jgi:hypothetical protein
VTNHTLRNDLQPGDTIHSSSGKSRYIIKTVTPQSDGVYKGQFLFWLEVWGVKVLCDYWDLSVNTDNEIVSMGFESVYDPKFLLDVDEALDYLNQVKDAVNEIWDGVEDLINGLVEKLEEKSTVNAGIEFVNEYFVEAINNIPNLTDDEKQSLINTLNSPEAQAMIKEMISDFIQRGKDGNYTDEEKKLMADNLKQNLNPILKLRDILWLGDIFGGLAPDNQEKEIEKVQTLFDHVYNNYSNYFEKSKTSDTNISDSQYAQWSVRNFSHQNKVCKALYAKLVQNEAPTFNLYENGIFVEKYKLDDKEYNVAVYSFAKDILLPRNDIKLTGYKDLADNKKVKAGYTKKYGFIVFYNESKQPIMLIQIAGNNPEEDAKQWLNYLAIVLKSEEQTKKDEAIKEKVPAIHTKEELPKVWNNVSESDNPEAIVPEDDFVTQQAGQCYQACVDIMKNFDENITVSWDSWFLAAKNENDEDCVVKECYEEAIVVLDGLITNRTPVIVGVDYKDGSSNSDNITDHWVVIVGKGTDAKGVYYTYYEVAKDQKEDGTSTKNNRFYFNNSGLLESIGKTTNSSKNTLIITILRVKPDDICCSRSLYESDKNYDSCDYKSHKSKPKGALIKIR